MKYTQIKARKGGKTYRLRLTTAGLIWFERQTGERFTRINDERFGAIEVAGLLGAALLHEMPDITIDEAAAIVDACGFAVVTEAVVEAFQRDIGGNDQLEPLTQPDPNAG